MQDSSVPPQFLKKSLSSVLTELSVVNPNEKYFSNILLDGNTCVIQPAV